MRNLSESPLIWRSDPQISSYTLPQFPQGDSCPALPHFVPLHISYTRPVCVILTTKGGWGMLLQFQIDSLFWKPNIESLTYLLLCFISWWDFLLFVFLFFLLNRLDKLQTSLLSNPTQFQIQKWPSNPQRASPQLDCAFSHLQLEPRWSGRHGVWLPHHLKGVKLCEQYFLQSWLCTFYVKRNRWGVLNWLWTVLSNP